MLYNLLYFIKKNFENIIKNNLVFNEIVNLCV